MNKREKQWYKYYKECNELDYEQIERFDEKDQDNILRIKLLIEIIEEQKKEIDKLKEKLKFNEALVEMYLEQLCKARRIIESFESGEMKVGEKYEQDV